MDTRLVRVVCASCEANYRIASDAVRGKVVDYCCSNCGAVIEVDGTSIELVAPTRPGQDPRDKLPRTPAPAMVAHSPTSFRVTAAAHRSYDTPAGLVRVKPPPPPSDAFSARVTPVQSTMPPPMSMPARAVAESDDAVQPPNDAPPFDERPAFVEQHPRRKNWIVPATLVAAVVVALIGRSLASRETASSSAAQAPPPTDPQTPVAARLQPSDFRGTATDPAQSAAPAVEPRTGASPEANVDPPKTEKRRKKGKLKTSVEETEPAAEEAAVEPAAPAAPPFEAPQPPPPPGPEFSREAAQSALEDAAALAATCRQDDTTAGAVRVAVTFVPSGQATVAVVESGVVRGTPVGSCVAAKFRTAKVPPFSGTKVTVHKTMMF
jgi:hypothetical protein